MEPICKYVLITGIILIVLGINMTIYGIRHKDGNKAQQSHAQFGVAVSCLGIALIVIPWLSHDVVSILPGASCIGLAFMFIVFPILKSIAHKIATLPGGYTDKKKKASKNKQN